MKKMVLEFFRRGVAACGLGPLVLAVLYLILQKTGNLETLTVSQVCTGIFSLSALAFLAGSLNVVYQVERLPLMAAVTIHGVVLYACYLVTYLVNGWLEDGMMSLLVFTCIFAVGYLLIWAVIYCIIRRNTDSLNEMLQEKQKHRDAMP
jgi:hypothetical protein